MELKTKSLSFPLLVCLLLAGVYTPALSFSIHPSKGIHNSRVQLKADLNTNHDPISDEPSTKNIASRRQTLSSLTKGVIASLVLPNLNPQSTLAAEIAVGTPENPIAIIGGGGRTGMAVAETLAGELGQMNGITMTRSGKNPFQIIKLPQTTKDRLGHFDKPVDVRDADGVLKALQEIKPSVVVYAASASKQGGNSFDVDDRGVENVARAAKNVGAEVVLISALALDRPESKSFKITNTLGGYIDKIMDAKFNGEMKTRDIMGKDYVIIRPGVLLSGKSKNGAKDIELNQGDTVGGGLSRDELAGVVTGAIQNGKRGITVEAYRKSTATKLQPEFVIPSGNEMTASSYRDLFSNAKSD